MITYDLYDIWIYLYLICHINLAYSHKYSNIYMYIYIYISCFKVLLLTIHRAICIIGNIEE